MCSEKSHSHENVQYKHCKAYNCLPLLRRLRIRACLVCFDQCELALQTSNVMAIYLKNFLSPRKRKNEYRVLTEISESPEKEKEIYRGLSENSEILSNILTGSRRPVLTGSLK